MTTKTLLQRYWMFCLLFLLLPKLSFGGELDTPTIVAGTSKITGRIISPNDKIENNIFIKFMVPHPISGEYVEYKAFVDKSGRFSIDVNVETTISLIGLITSLDPKKSLLVKLTSGNVTNIDITYNSSFDINTIQVTPSMSQSDITQPMDVIVKMITYRSNRAPQPLYNKTPQYFLNWVKTPLDERLEIVKNDSLISKDLKPVLFKDYRLFYYDTFIFDYEKEMDLNYQNTNNGDNSKKPDFQKIDRSYYRFLNDFNLNDSQYLICSTFLMFQKTLLQNEIVGLPLIEETDIPSWLAKVKVILADLVGFNDGPYYDILVANAYARQLNEEVRPLSEKQKENITNYWKDGEIAKILFRKNQQVVELNKAKTAVVVNDIASVSKDKVIEAILLKNKGKVVFIDLWATWCGPCLKAMNDFRSTKGEFHDKNVAFVYLTNGSSPKKLWEEKIKGIGGEQYYLNSTQWEFVMDQFQFEYIPSYLLYNKEGVLINKFSAFPGNEEVKSMINGLL
nr:thiol:disulfide interchange protein tlpA [uncultured bacterium]